MWTLIFLFLCTIGISRHKSITIPLSCAKRVQKCPVERSQWLQKKEQLKCATDYGYVCLRDLNGYLFETCMENLPIQANVGNCPILFACVNNKPYLGTISTFYRCPMEVSGCPPKNHTQYSIHQLYKYPKCVESNFSDEIGNTSPISTTSISMTTISTSHIEEQDNKTVIILIIVAAVLLTAVGCYIGYIVYLRTRRYDIVNSRKKNYDYSKATRDEIEDLSDRIVYLRTRRYDIVNSRKKNYDYSKATRGEIKDLSDGSVNSRKKIYDYSKATRGEIEDLSNDYSKATRGEIEDLSDDYSKATRGEIEDLSDDYSKATRGEIEDLLHGMVISMKKKQTYV